MSSPKQSQLQRLSTDGAVGLVSGELGALVHSPILGKDFPFEKFSLRNHTIIQQIS